MPRGYSHATENMFSPWRRGPPTAITVSESSTTITVYNTGLGEPYRAASSTLQLFLRWFSFYNRFLHVKDTLILTSSEF